MKNRERLLKMSVCDMLCGINRPMLGYCCNCVMEALSDVDSQERCKKHKGICRDCIAAWLNEEAHQ